jgi:hypothetical protein
MSIKKLLSYYIAALLMSQTPYSVAGDSVTTHGPIVPNVSKSGITYYHMAYTMSYEALVSLEKLSKNEFIASGGQFEVLLSKRHFPVSAPKCKTNIILRMPWTESTSHIDEKYELYARIRNIVEAKEGSVSIVIELNPYVRLNGSELELTNCNVFFRHARGNYISHTKSLQ